MATNIYFPNIAAPSYPLNEQFENNVIRSVMEDGTVKTRLRYTRNRKTFSLTWSSMSEGDKILLENFYLNTTRSGCLSFNWEHPLSHTVFQVRFTEPPTFNLSTINLWQTSISLQEV